MTGCVTSWGFSYTKTQGVMKGSDRDGLMATQLSCIAIKSLSFKNYLNLDYSDVSMREGQCFQNFPGESVPQEKNEDESGGASVERFTLIRMQILPTYLQELKNYNPLYDMTLGSSDETTSFGFTNNFEIDWQGLMVCGRKVVLVFQSQRTGGSF